MSGNKVAYDPHQPQLGRDVFRCPHCQVVAKQQTFGEIELGRFTSGKVLGFGVTVCEACKEQSYWQNYSLIRPITSTAPLANSDMPNDVRKDFDEARSVLAASPRAAAALLRLGLQRLLKHIGGKGKKIDDDIAELVKNGLPDDVQEAADTLRVIGNNMVHPGSTDDKDNAQVAQSLFMLLNYVVERTISQPKQRKELFDGLPKGAKEGIAKRDGK